jgi:hypothetical protein
MRAVNALGNILDTTIRKNPLSEVTGIANKKHLFWLGKETVSVGATPAEAGWAMRRASRWNFDNE